MQGKSAIRFFAIAISVACLYSLSFSWLTSNVENDAKEYANGDKSLEKNYLDSIQNETILNLGFVEYTYKDCKSRQLNLGLDLKGGMNVTMEISLVDLLRSMSGNSKDINFNKALQLASEKQKSSQADYLTLFFESYKELAPESRLAAIFATKENQGRINFNSTDEEVGKVIRAEADKAIDRSFNILRTRIDKFGVTQPNIQLQGTSNRVLIELPGVDNPERVRKLLQGTAQLEFWETFENVEVYPVLESINKALAAKVPAKDTTKTTTNDTSKKGNEPALLSQLNKTEGSVDTAAEIANFGKNNPLFAVMAPATYTNEQNQQMLAPGSVVGYVAEKDTAKVTAMLKDSSIVKLIPSNLLFRWSVKAIENTNTFMLYALKANGRDKAPVLEGDVISSAREDFDQRGNPEVIMSMNSTGSKIWRRVTAEASKDPQNKKCIAIVLDNYVYSAPVVQNEISGGVSSISGNFTIEETKDMANILQAGKLPAPAKIVEEAIVGPSLGKEAISSGLISSLVGLLAVLIFMVIYYSQAGWFANLALFVNVFFIMGILASLGAVLTLPGIAGIVLTIGMSVDANVLIYERIREELASGKGNRLAIADGYKNAYSSIIDANVTTLITGIILYVFGSGPILGFATTLIIGILTSLFSAIFITRLLFEARVNADKSIRFVSPFFKSTWFENSKFDFVSRRKVFYAISSLIIVAGIVSLFTKGLNLGVDFKGGRSYIVRFDEDVTTQNVREALTTSFGISPEVKTFGSNNQIKITTSYLIDNQDEAADAQVEQALLSGLSSLNKGGEIMSSQKVGPTIANDIKVSAVYAIVLSILAIFLYIVVRFRRWQFGLGAVVALFHDVMVLISIFSIFNGILPFSLDVDQAFIAAILTVMGYSINDTVVVFDRIREYLNLHHTKNEGLSEVINNALNSTLSRTVVTGLTTILVLIILFFFGGEVIRGFSFAMLLGVVFGTYSSLFVATPIVIDFIKKKN
jgi:SecD/SecF fusion protein